MDLLQRIFLGIIDAVQYLHSKNFYHCDIAPKNIFLKTGRNKDIFAILGDFGAGNTISKKVPANIKVIGTCKYMPEEVKKLRNKEISSEKFSELQPRWDIALCVDELVETHQARPPIKSKLFLSKSRKRLRDLSVEDCQDAQTFLYRQRSIWSGF